MTRPLPAWLARLAVRVYALILRRYPAPFRERCGRPMLDTFEQLCLQCLEQGTLWRLVRTCAAEYADALAAVRRSRLEERSLPGLRNGEARRDPLLAVFVQDCRYAVRRLRAQPALVVFTVLTLGFAIGATAAIFSVVDAVLLRPSLFAEPDRLLHLVNRTRQGSLVPGLSREKLKQWRSETGIFETVEGYRTTSAIVTGGVEPEEVPAAYLSPGLLVTLGVPPRHGRFFASSEAAEGQNAKVIVSEQFWRSRLGANPAAVGRILSVNGRAHEIVGIMPRGFHFPTLREQVWLPLDFEARPAFGQPPTNVVVRLKRGLTVEAAQPRIAAAVQRLEAERPLPGGWGIVVDRGSLTGPNESTRRTVLILFGAVALVLLTACANVANLLLSRAVDRRREFAIRLVLGASRWRLVRELVAEGVLLGHAAGALGLLAARWAVDSLVTLAPPAVMYATTTAIAVDGRVFLFGLALAVATGVLCNLPPALRSLRANGSEALSGRTRTSTATPVQRRIRAGLVVLEISLAVVLLVGAALMVRSFMKLNAVDIGYDPDRLLAVSVGLDTRRYDSEASRASLLRRVTADLEQVPGVSAVAFATGMPPVPGTRGMALIASDQGPCIEERTGITSTRVSPSYFGVMGMRMVEGRPLRADDPPDAVVISRSISQLCGGSLVGRRIRLDDGAPWLQVVGVAADVKTRGLKAADGDIAVYLSFAADPAVLPMVASMLERRVEPRHLIVRTDRPAALIPEVKRLLWTADPDQPVLHALPAADLMGDSIRQERFMLALMTLFSGVALALASAGIFGVLAYTVAQRTNEIGIRVALGASASDIRRLIVGQGVLLAAAGTAAGAGAAWALARVLAGLLYEVQPRDPAAFILTPLLVLTVALLASWIPTARALAVDPASALRVE